MSRRTVEGDSLVIADEKGNCILEIREKLEGNIMVLTLSGEMTAEMAHEFDDELTGVVTVCRHVIIDLGNVTMISSSGLKTLLSMQQTLDRRDGELLIRHLSAPLEKIFNETGFIDIFEIEE